MENYLAGKEGAIAQAIEKQTSKIPTNALLWTSLGSVAVSIILQMTGRKRASRFIWQWAAPFLIMGLYNKLSKSGSNHTESRNLALES
jgi:hypothetical protein